MVRLHVKHGDESQFLLDTTVDAPVNLLVEQVTSIYNGRLQVSRIRAEMEELAEHGITLPPNMQGLTDEQIEELRLKDEWETKCVPSGGSVFKKDEIGRRNGHAPNENMKKVLQKTVEEAKALISKKQAEANICVTMDVVKDALDQLRGAVMIVYPMGLPPHDPIRMEFENNEDLSGTQAGQMVIEDAAAKLWWAGKELLRKQKLADYVGKNEKTKIIVKIQKESGGSRSRANLPALGWGEWVFGGPMLQGNDLTPIPGTAGSAVFGGAGASGKMATGGQIIAGPPNTSCDTPSPKGHGAPAREPVISEEEQKNMMMYYHRRQEELKNLEEDEDISYLNAEWADSSSLKRQFQGVKDIKWRLK